MTGIGAECVLDLGPSARIPDLVLPDHAGGERRLADLTDGDPLALNFFRSWWCPPERRYFRERARLQDEFEVGYTRLVSISVYLPGVQSAFRAGLDARWASTFCLDSVRCAGAVTVLHNPEPIADDPFARLFRGTLVRVECFAEVPAPPGPVVERYAGPPWPAEGFSP